MGDIFIMGFNTPSSAIPFLQLTTLPIDNPSTPYIIATKSSTATTNVIKVESVVVCNIDTVPIFFTLHGSTTAGDIITKQKIEATETAFLIQADAPIYITGSEDLYGSVKQADPTISPASTTAENISVIVNGIEVNS